MHSKICTENLKLGQNRGRVVLVRASSWWQTTRKGIEKDSEKVQKKIRNSWKYFQSLNHRRLCVTDMIFPIFPIAPMPPLNSVTIFRRFQQSKWFDYFQLRASSLEIPVLELRALKRPLQEEMLSTLHQ